MKRKILITALLAALVVSFSLFAGCFKLWNNGTRIAFKNEPASRYFVGDGIETLNFTIIDKNNNNSVVGTCVAGKLQGEDGVEFSITGFSTATTGTRTFVVKYGKYQLDFQYTVLSIDNLFANGTGEAQTPYEIETTAQFRSMLESGIGLGYKYYRITRDLDFSDEEPLKQPKFWDTYSSEKDAGKVEVFQGVISGGKTPEQAHTVSGLDKILVNGNEESSKRAELFGAVGNFTLENIKFDFNAKSDNCMTGLVTSGIPGSVVTFKNVTTTGEIDCLKSATTSVAVYVAQIGRGGEHKAVFTNCVNKVNIKNSTTKHFVAAFATTQNASEVVFENCKNEGNVQGGLHGVSGMFLTNVKTAKLTMRNCESNGKVYKTTDAADMLVVCAKDTNSEYNPTIIGSVKDKDMFINSLTSMTLTMTGKAYSLTNVPKSGVDHYLVVVQGRIKYNTAKNSSGSFLYSVNVSTNTSGTLLPVRLAKQDENFGTFANLYGNAFVVKKDEKELVYTETNLANSIQVEKCNVAVYAYSTEGAIIGYSNTVANVNLAA